MNNLNSVRSFGHFNVKTMGRWIMRGDKSFEHPNLSGLDEHQRLERGIELSKQLLDSKNPNWDQLTRLLQIVSDGAILIKDIAIKDLLIRALNSSFQSSIDEIEGRKHNNCPSRIYYESLRGLSNYKNTSNSYPLGIYPIYLPNTLDPLAKYSEIPESDPGKPVVDVVVLHGICGSPFRTWRISKFMESPYKSERPRDLCWYWLWPRELLAKEFPNVRVIAVEYHSQFLKVNSRFQWTKRLVIDQRRWVGGEWIEDFQRLESGDFMGLAGKFCKKLRQAGVGDNPLLILGHSFGGLLTLLMLLSDPSLMNNLKAIVGYAVPYLGSNQSRTPSTINMLRLIGMEFTETIKKICDDSFITNLLSEFSKLVENKKFKIYTYEETIETRITKVGIDSFIVERERAKPPFADYHYLPPNSCHNDVCKPVGIDDIRFTPIAQILKNIYNNSNIQ